MKSFLFFISLILVGCQSRPAAVTVVPPVPALPAPEPRPIPNSTPAPAANLALEQRIRQQAQFIEALISQNDALTAKLNAASARTPAPAEVVTTPKPIAPQVAPNAVPPPQPPPSPAKPPEPPTLTPNADGVIDLAAAGLTMKPGEPVNPFAVRMVPAESIREVALRVGGVIAGPVACAVINDRLVQAGEAIESLTVERIDADAVVLRHSGHRLRLPVSGKNIRVRLPL